MTKATPRMKASTTGFSRLIRTEAEYSVVLRDIEQLLDADPPEGSAAEERLEFLSVLVEDYDRKHHELPGPEATPLQVVEFLLDAQGIDKAELAPIMGGRSRVSEFLNGKRALSMAQVLRLRDVLQVPADSLLAAGEPRPYKRIRVGGLTMVREGAGPKAMKKGSRRQRPRGGE